MQEVQKTIAEITRRLRSQFHPRAIILFGSHAWGQPGDESDIDLLIVKDSDENRHQMGVQVQKLLFDIDCDLGLLVYQTREVKERKNLFFRRILNEGKVLYGSL